MSYGKINKKATNEALVRWACGEIKGSERVGKVLLEEDACYSYGHHFMLGTRFPGSNTFVVYHDSYHINGRTSTMTEQHKRALHWALREHLGEGHYDEYVVDVDYDWGPHPAIGQALNSRVRAKLTAEATPAMMKHWPHAFDPTTRRLKYDLWEGDPQKLRVALGANGCARFDIAVVEYLIHYQGLDAALAYTGTPEYAAEISRFSVNKEAISDLLIRVDLGDPAQGTELGTLMKTQKKLMGVLKAVKGGARSQLAAEWLLSCNRFRKEIAEGYFRELNFRTRKECA